MRDESEKSKLRGVPNRRDHMANERTFLAWVRTSVGIMAFGFVVEKFALFMKRLPLFIEKPKIYDTAPSSHEYSTVFGIVLVAIGALWDCLHLSDIKRLNEKLMKMHIVLR